jgi:hypothetical protein
MCKFLLAFTVHLLALAENVKRDERSKPAIYSPQKALKGMHNEMKELDIGGIWFVLTMCSEFEGEQSSTWA